VSLPAGQGFPTLTLRGGGWVIVATAVLLLAFMAWALSGVFLGERPVGHGPDPAAYGFALEPLKADRAFLAGTGNPRDFLPALDRPQVIRGSEVLRWNEEHRRKLLVSTDRVAGIVVNGDARAYPLATLNAHEVVNDVVGGVPVAITFSPLTDSLVAFDRRAIPATANLDAPDERCVLDHVRGQPRERTVRIAASNSFGFGGANLCLILERAA